MYVVASLLYCKSLIVLYLALFKPSAQWFGVSLGRGVDLEFHLAFYSCFSCQGWGSCSGRLLPSDCFPLRSSSRNTNKAFDPALLGKTPLTFHRMLQQLPRSSVRGGPWRGSVTLSEVAVVPLLTPGVPNFPSQGLFFLSGLVHSPACDSRAVIIVYSDSRCFNIFHTGATHFGLATY